MLDYINFDIQIFVVTYLILFPLSLILLFFHKVLIHLLNYKFVPYDVNEHSSSDRSIEMLRELDKEQREKRDV